LKTIFKTRINSSMPPFRPCHRTRLATNSIATVEACSCSMIHLNLGATTVRFTREAFEGLTDVVLAAAAELVDAVLHVHLGPLSLRLERSACEELTTTLARAMVHLARARPRAPGLELLPGGRDA
jgi:hypothetical protein